MVLDRAFEIREARAGDLPALAALPVAAFSDARGCERRGWVRPRRSAERKEDLDRIRERLRQARAHFKTLQ